MVAHLLPKQRAAGSNPVSRSTIYHQRPHARRGVVVLRGDLIPVRCERVDNAGDHPNHKLIGYLGRQDVIIGVARLLGQLQHCYAVALTSKCEGRRKPRRAQFVADKLADLGYIVVSECRDKSP